MGKISAYPPDTAPTTDDYFLTVDATTGSNRKVLLSDLLTLFFTQTIIPTGGGSPVTRASETQSPAVTSGLVWSADSVGVNRNASMTAGVIYINGRRIAINAVNARNFTASVDTYIDILDNLDGTGTVVYTTAVNNAASATLAANSVRIGIIVTGATTIATTASINQGSPYATLPTTTSSIPLAVCDTIGNLIYPSPNQRLIGVRVYPTGAGPSQSGAAATAINAGLNIPVLAANVPQRGKIRASLTSRSANTSAGIADVQLFQGSTAGQSLADYSFATTLTPVHLSGVGQTTADTTIIPTVLSTGAGTVTLQAFNGSLVHWVERD